MVVTGAAVASEVVVVVSVGETVEATEEVVAAEDLAGATKWVEGSLKPLFFCVVDDLWMSAGVVCLYDQ